jgi:GR25 family glycosyltransferase involved in LPS biosynthesis
MAMDLTKENCYFGYLNMAHREDRYGHINNQLAKVDIQAVRHRGKRPEEYDLNDPKIQVMKARSPGAIGCMFGQMEIMKRGLEAGLHSVVFEDDILFCSDFQKRFDYIGNWAKAHEWDIIWLGASFHVNPPYWHRHGHSGMPPDCSAQLGYDVLPTDDPHMIRTLGAYCTFAYIVNHNSIQKILDYLDSFMHRTIGIDYSFIAAAKFAPELKFFSFVPGCVMQMDNKSDIGKGMTIWSGQLNNGPYVFQDKMEDFDPTTYKWK